MKIGDRVEIALEDGSTGEGFVMSFDAETVCIVQYDENSFGEEVSMICFEKQKAVKVINE